MASNTTKKKIPPMFWVTCTNKDAKHPHKFGYEPEAVKNYLLRLKDGYAKTGASFTGVIAMLDHAQEEILKG